MSNVLISVIQASVLPVVRVMDLLGQAFKILLATFLFPVETKSVALLA